MVKFLDIIFPLCVTKTVFSETFNITESSIESLVIKSVNEITVLKEIL